MDRILPTGAILDSECPCCSHPLQTGLIEGRRGLYCDHCFGILLRHEDFAGIIQERQSRRTGIESSEPRAIDPASFERRLNCPSCQVSMDVHPYYGPGNIVIDTCVPCGFMWLDHGELTRVEHSVVGRSPSICDASDSARSAAGPHSSIADEQMPDPTRDSPFRILADLLF